VGVAGLFAVLADVRWRWRALLGAVFGVGMYGVGLFWVTGIHDVGYVALVLLSASFLVAAAAATPSGQGRALVFPGALVLADGLRGKIPFGGFPLAGLPLSQAQSPLVPSVRVGGQLVLTGLVAAGAVALVARKWRTAAVVLAVMAALVVGGRVAPSGHDIATPAVRIAVVQGGGPRGLRKGQTDPQAVFVRHLEATRAIDGTADLVLWPEDVVDVDLPIEETDEATEIGAEAQRLHATLVAGVVEDNGEDRFRNAAVVWAPDGKIVGRYDKVHRVPFGEYVPGRFIIRHLADLSIIPRDATPGHGSGMVRTPAGPVGLMVSYEVFFPDRARSGVRAGGQILLVPTNAASFATGQVPAQEVAAARTRAWETGRWVVQAAPTGYAAIITPNGRVVQRSSLGARAILHASVPRRTGRTPYVVWGDLPILLLAVGLIAAGWARTRSEFRPS
jgi:apolipoprotein N-acyltransferase